MPPFAWVASKPTHAKPNKQGQTCWMGTRIDPFNTSDYDMLMDATGGFQQPISQDGIAGHSSERMGQSAMAPKIES